MTKRYKESALKIIRALDVAGTAVGLHLWRPGKGGPYGQFQVGEMVIDGFECDDLVAAKRYRLSRRAWMKK